MAENVIDIAIKPFHATSSLPPHLTLQSRDIETAYLNGTDDSCDLFSQDNLWPSQVPAPLKSQDLSLCRIYQYQHAHTSLPQHCANNLKEKGLKCTLAQGRSEFFSAGRSVGTPVIDLFAIRKISSCAVQIFFK